MKILSIFLSFILLLNISQQKEDSDHRDGREYDPTSKNEEIQIEIQTNTTSNNTTTNKTVVVKAPLPTILPEAKIILPIRRIGTSLSDFDIGPCGGIQKLKADTLTNKGSHINFVWETVTPAKNGNCTVRISPGMENIESFKTLIPSSGSHNKDGSFSCGTEKGFDSKEFKLPDDYECDGCILQFEWTTPYGNYYSCSDIIINGELMSTCLSKCQNGGTCFNGKCICVKGFSGEFCEDEDGKKVSICKKASDLDEIEGIPTGMISLDMALGCQGFPRGRIVEISGPEHSGKTSLALEAIANAHSGVDKTYAIQAGREIRVMVKPEQISDDEAQVLAHDIAKEIEAKLEYPGHIKVNVIRESRFSDTAK